MATSFSGEEPLTRRVGAWPLVAAAAAAAGGAYAWSAYAVSPAALPLALLAAGALALGIWRLEWGLALLLFVTPFSENAELSDPGAARLRLALIGWAAVLVAVRLVRLARSGERISPPPMTVGVLCFLGAALIGVPVAENHAAAAGKLLLLAGSATIFTLIAVSLPDWRRLEIVLAGAVLGGLVVSVDTIYEKFSGHLSEIGWVDAGGTVEYRVTSFFSHPNQLAGFLAVLIPVCIFLARAATRRWLRAAAGTFVVLGLVAVLMTYSRGALVGLLALPLLWIRDPRSWPVLLVTAMIIAVLAPGTWRDRIAGAGSLQTPEIATRVDIWQAAVDAFQERPLVGWGLNDFPTAYLALERTGRDFLGTGHFDVPPTAHDLYLNVAAEQGLLGLAALLGLAIAIGRLILLLRRDQDPRRRGLGTALFGVALVLALHNLFDVTFVDPKTSTLVWALLGVGAAFARRPASAPNG
jgi:putative inorganic carbon (HCO3(-)) transporter